MPRIPFFGPSQNILFHDLVTRLDGVANTAMVELGVAQVVGHFAEKRFLKQPFFRNGMSRQHALLIIR